MSKNFTEGYYKMARRKKGGVPKVAPGRGNMGFGKMGGKKGRGRKRR